MEMARPTMVKILERLWTTIRWSIMVAGTIGMVALPTMGIKKRLRAELRHAAEFFKTLKE